MVPARSASWSVPMHVLRQNARVVADRHARSICLTDAEQRNPLHRCRPGSGSPATLGTAS